MRISNAQLDKILAVHLHHVNRASAVSGTSASNPDELVLSTKAVEMQRVKQAVADLPEVRSDVVNTLKQQLTTGAYSIDPQAIAEGLLDERR